MDSLTITTHHSDAAYAEALKVVNQTYAGRATPSFPLTLLAGALLGAALIVLVRLGLGFNPETSHFIAFGLGAVATLAFWAWCGRLQWKAVQAAAADAGRDAGPQTYHFDATGFVLTSNVGRSEIAWHAVRAIVAGPTAITIVLGAMSLPLPIKDLPEGMDTATVVAQLERWRVG